MDGKTVLVTGATSGIGKQTALELACLGATVLVHGRDRVRGERALDEIRRACGHDRLEFVLADFASLRQVRALAADIQARHKRLDVLVNNAGVFLKRRQLTEDGLEMTFVVNHLAPFLLTLLLLDLLKKSSPSRIINVSSTSHQGAVYDPANLQGEKSYDGYRAYALSKLGNLWFTYDLAERLRGSGVTVNALHPGVIDTALLRAGYGNMGGGSLQEGAETPVYLASSPEVEDVTGQYFVRKRPVNSSALSRDERLRAEFWQTSVRLAGL